MFHEVVLSLVHILLNKPQENDPGCCLYNHDKAYCGETTHHWAPDWLQEHLLQAVRETVH